MGVATAVAATGVAASVFGGAQAAQGAREASQAANAQAQDWMSQIAASKKQAQAAYAQYSPAQQASLDKAMAAQQQDLSRQQTLVSSINPSLIDAGKQMQQLLQGQSAPVLQNLQGQRQLQRQNLLDTLRQQLGPGAETSSMGQNQLQKFDAETSNIMSGAQQSYLQEVSGLALNGNATLGQSISSATSNLGKLADSYGQIGLNQANIITGAQNQMGQAQQAAVATAGAAGQGRALQGQMIGNLGSSLIQGAAMYSALGSKPGAPTAPDQSGGTGTLGNSVGQNQPFTMPTLGGSYPTNSYNSGQLGGSVAAGRPSTGAGTYASSGAVPAYLQANSPGATNYNYNPYGF